MKIGRLFIVLTVFCIFTAAPVRAGIPPALVEQTVQVLVSRGATRSPALVKAVTDYYVQVASRSGAALKPTVENFVVLEHAQKFVTSNPGLFSPAQAKQLQDQLTNDLNRALSTRQEVVPLGTALERAARPQVPADFKISVPEQMITMEQAVAYFAPGWREQLFGLFDKQGLDAIEQALKITDQQFFALENGQVNFISGENWNYTEQFGIELRAILDKQGVTFTDRQWKLIFGGFASLNAPLAMPLKLLSVECFLAEYGRLPAPNATDPVEKSLGTWISHFKTKYKGSTDSSMQGVLDFFEENKRNKTQQKWEEALEQHIRNGGSLARNTSDPFYVRYDHNKKALKQADEGKRKLSAEDRDSMERYNARFDELCPVQQHRPSQEWEEALEQHIRNGGSLSRDMDPFYSRYIHNKEELRKADEGKRELSAEDRDSMERYNARFDELCPIQKQNRTPQEWLLEARQFMVAGGELVNSHSAPGHRFFLPYYRYKRGLKAGIYPEETPYIDYIQYIAANQVRQRNIPQTLEEVYDYFLKYLKEFKTYPKRSGETEPLYVAVYNRMYVNPQPENPTWQKLKRLDDLARAAQRGEKPWELFDQSDPLKRPRIGEKETESPSVIEITPEELQVIKDVEKNYEELYENFPVWMQDNHRYFIPTYNTVTVFRNLERQVVTMGKMTDTLSEILDILNEMDLGATEDGFNRVIFRGNNLNNPKPTDFHVVSEHNWIPSTMSESAVESLPPTIEARTNGQKYLTTLYLQPGVTADDIDAVIGQIKLPEGWEIRMGNHEIGFTDNGGLTDKARNGWIHLHIETVAAETEEEMYDLSYTLQINTRALIEGKNEVQIRSLYKRLFGNYYR